MGMNEFVRIKIKDIKLLEKYLNASGKGICDYTAGTVVMWRDFFDTEYAVVDDTLVLRVNYFGKRAYSFPVGNNVAAALKFEIADAEFNGEKPLFCAVTKEDAEFLAREYNTDSIIPDTDWFDYVYDIKTFFGFPGKKLSGQRNHINHFEREHPNAHTEIICRDNINDVEKFFATESAAAAAESGDGKTAADERRIVSEVLENYDRYGESGLALFDGGKVIAFAIGENVGDTLFVHIEKADRNINGAYQKIASEFARMFYREGIVWLNREEDAGDEGLRQSKLSYHPCRLIEKYLVKLA